MKSTGSSPVQGDDFQMKTGKVLPQELHDTQAQDDHHSLKIFRAHAQTRYKALMKTLKAQFGDSLTGVSKWQIAELGWFQLAAVIINPCAAFDLNIIAEAAKSVNDDSAVDASHRRGDPLTYLEEWHFGIPRRWMDTLKDWERDFWQNEIARQYQQYELQVQTLRKANDTFRIQLSQLSHHMSSEYFCKDGDEDTFVNPLSAMRAAHHLHYELKGIEDGLLSFVERLKTNGLPMNGVQQYSRDENLGGMNLRRRRADRAGISDDENPTLRRPPSSNDRNPPAQRQENLSSSIAALFPGHWITQTRLRLG